MDFSLLLVLAVPVVVQAALPVVELIDQLLAVQPVGLPVEPAPMAYLK
jgi:hypothetical protein